MTTGYKINIDLHHQFGISVAESQTFLHAKHPEERGEMAVFTGYDFPSILENLQQLPFFFIKEDILIPFSLYAITAWLIIVRNYLVVMRDYFYRLLSPTTDHR